MNEKTPVQLRNDALGKKVVESLKKRGFEAVYCEDSTKALEAAISYIPETDVVAWGGSMTIDFLKIKDVLKNRGQKMIDRDNAKTGEERIELMRQGLLSDTFLMSSNAITYDGQLFNIDGNGNRLGALVYGPKSVIVVAGINKVTKNLESAIERTRNLASPMNKQRFGGTTPCLKNGICGDCLCEDTICNQFVITRACRPKGRIKVILVGENLGF